MASITIRRRWKPDELVLVIGADSLWDVTDQTDRGTAILFADGGGAVVLSRSDQSTLLGFDLGCDDNTRHLLYIDHGDKIKMDGREVFRHAVRAMVGSTGRVLEQAGQGVGQIPGIRLAQDPAPGKLDRAEVLVAVEKRGFDGVVIARLQNVKKDQKYVPAQPMHSSDLYMSGYDEKYAVNSSPAHYEQRKTYRVETTLYSVRDEMLAWVAFSDTVNPASVEDVIHSVSARVAAQMKAEGLLGLNGEVR